MQDKYPFAKVAIIVPCYNQGEYLAECLDSVIQQTYSDWVCVVVNDGSTDNTEEIAIDYCEKESRIYYHPQSNAGGGAARNNGIKCCRSQFILPLDADDLIAPTFLEKTLKVIEDNPSVKVVHTKCQLFGRTHGQLELPEFSFRLLLQRNLMTVTALYRREDYLRTQGYDEKIKGWYDWDFWLSLLDKDSQVKKIEEPLFFYRLRFGSLGSNISLDPELKSSLRNYIYHKHESKYLEYPNDVDILAFRISALEKDYKDALVNNDINQKLTVGRELRALERKFYPLRLVRKLSRILNLNTFYESILKSK